MATNFLSKDGYLNVEAFVGLAREIDKLAIKEGFKPTDIYFAGKVIPKFDVAKAKAGGEAFTKKRAQVIKTKKRMPPAGSRVRMVVLLRDYKGFDEAHPEFNKDFDAALDAIERHNKLAEKTIGSMKAAGAKKREVAAKEFDANADAFMELLEQAGVSERDIAVGTSMMGKTIIVKLPNGGYVSVGKADKERFLKARDAAPAAAPRKAKTAARGAERTSSRAERPAKKVAAKPGRTEKPVAKAAAKKVVRKPGAARR